MGRSVSAFGNPGVLPCHTRRLSQRGFTLIELMIVMVIVAIGVALAVPTFNSIIEKRRMTATVEEIASFLTFAQSEAIKDNEEVTVSWFSPGGHNANWCIGATEGDDVCDCRETDPAEDDYCEIEGNPYRLTQADFVDMSFEFMHMNPAVGNFSFDPVRGIVADFSSTEIIDGDWLFYIHSDEGSGRTRDYELEVRLNITGRVHVCTDLSRKMRIGGFAPC